MEKKGKRKPITVNHTGQPSRGQMLVKSGSGGQTPAQLLCDKVYWTTSRANIVRYPIGMLNSTGKKLNSFILTKFFIYYQSWCHHLLSHPNQKHCRPGLHSILFLYLSSCPSTLGYISKNYQFTPIMISDLYSPVHPTIIALTQAFMSIIYLIYCTSNLPFSNSSFALPR